MSSINDSLSVLNVDQLNSAVSLAHMLPLQPDGNQATQLTLPIQNTSHAMLMPASLPRITVSTTIPSNTINSGSLPFLMQLNPMSQRGHTISHIQTPNTSSFKQITIPVLQEQQSHVLVPMQNVTSATLGTCTLQSNTMAATEQNADMRTLFSSPNQLNTLLHLNHIGEVQLNDSSIQRQNVNNLQVITSLPVTMTTPRPVLTSVNQSASGESSKLTSENSRAYLVNLKLPITNQNNQPIKINSTAPVQSTADISTAANGQHLQTSLPGMNNQPIQKSNLSSLTTTSLNVLNLMTQANEFESCHGDGTQQQMILTQDPVAAASLVAGVTDNLEEDSFISVDSQLDNEFDTSLWCVECNTSHPLICPAKGELHCVPDSPILSHARQTLPSVLQIKASSVAANVDGVFARGTVAARSQFGPLKGRIVKEAGLSSDLDHPTQWKIFKCDEVHHCIDASDEKVCNWMMFVRNARMSLEQNLVAYQWGQYIFFTTTRAIQPGEELLYWYSGNYAKNKGLKDKPEQCFWCTKCNRQFVSAIKLSRHMKYSHPDMSDRKFKCSNCSRAFLCLTKLNVHQMTHSNVKPHKCNICDKTFTDPSNLRTHRLIHSDVKKFKCPQCERAFRQKAHLVTHMVTHTGEKKLKCPECDKLFSRQSDVKTHMYFHTKEKQAKCPLCFKEFWNPQQYRRHMKSHARESEYNCGVCKRGFHTITHFKRHQDSAICQRNNIALSGDKSQERRGRGRVKARKRNNHNTTPKPIAPANSPISISKQSSVLVSCDQDLGTMQPISVVTIGSRPLSSSSTWRKRSMRISQRRKQGKVMNYSGDRSLIQESPESSTV